MIYCFDMSAFIAARQESFPNDVTPKLWSDYLPGLVAAKRMVPPKDVVLELEKKTGKDDELCQWVKSQDGLVRALDDALLKEIKRIVNRYRRLIEQKPGRNRAARIVIALASVTGSTVVTKEGMSNSLEKPKIPDVCRAEGIKCTGMLDVIRAEKWVSR